MSLMTVVINKIVAEIGEINSKSKNDGQQKWTTKITHVFDRKFDNRHFSSLVEKLNKFDLSAGHIYDLSQLEIRRCFALCEKILWYYNDHLTYIANHHYKIKNLYVLLRLFFSHLHDEHIKYLTNQYNNLVRSIPVAGVILISNEVQKPKVLLVRNNFSKIWSYPKGKLEPFEKSLDAAVRECREETGYDVSGLINPNRVIIRKYGRKLVYFYVVTGVSMNFHFKPENDKEIVDIQWFDVDDSLSKSRQFNAYINRSYSHLKRILQLS